MTIVQEYELLPAAAAAVAVAAAAAAAAEWKKTFPMNFVDRQ